MSAQPAETPAAESRRRHLLLAAVAAGAALAGAGVAWRKWRPQPVADDAAAAIWPLTFASPTGAVLEMSSLRGKPLLLNFWATWCPPCVQELPRLNAFYGSHKADGWQVLGLAIDQVASVRGFLQRSPLTFPVVLGGAAGMGLVRDLGNPNGALPFSVLFDANGTIAERKIGELSETDLQQWRASV